MVVKSTDPAAETFVQVCAQVIADASRRSPGSARSPQLPRRKNALTTRRSSRRK